MSGPGSSPVRDGGHRKAGISGAWNVPSIFVSRLTHGTLLHRILITRRLWDCCQSGYCRFGMQVTWATILSCKPYSSGLYSCLLQGLFTPGLGMAPLNAVLVVWLCARLFEYNHPLAWLSDYASETLPGDVSAFGNAWSLLP